MPKNSILNLWNGSEYVPDFKYVRVLNIRRFLLIWQGSECVGMQLWKGSAYSRNLSMRRFCIYKRCTRFWICLNNALWQSSEYAWSKFLTFSFKFLKYLKVMISKFYRAFNFNVYKKNITTPWTIWTLEVYAISQTNVNPRFILSQINKSPKNSW